MTTELPLSALLMIICLSSVKDLSIERSFSLRLSVDSRESDTNSNAKFCNLVLNSHWPSTSDSLGLSSIWNFSKDKLAVSKDERMSNLLKYLSLIPKFKPFERMFSSSWFSFRFEKLKIGKIILGVLLFEGPEMEFSSIKFEKRL